MMKTTTKTEAYRGYNLSPLSFLGFVVLVLVPALGPGVLAEEVTWWNMYNVLRDFVSNVLVADSLQESLETNYEWKIEEVDANKRFEDMRTEVSRIFEDAINAVTSLKKIIEMEIYMGWFPKNENEGIQNILCCDIVSGKVNKSESEKLGCAIKAQSNSRALHTPKSILAEMDKTARSFNNSISQYYAFMDGSVFVYPPPDMDDHTCNNYDPRSRYYFNQCRSPEPREVVVVVDPGEFVEATEATFLENITERIMSSLNPIDRIGFCLPNAHNACRTRRMGDESTFMWPNNSYPMGTRSLLGVIVTRSEKNSKTITKHFKECIQLMNSSSPLETFNSHEAALNAGFDLFLKNSSNHISQLSKANYHRILVYVTTKSGLNKTSLVAKVTDLQNTTLEYSKPVFILPISRAASDLTHEVLPDENNALVEIVPYANAHSFTESPFNITSFGLTNVTRAVIPIPYWDAFGAGYILSICLPLTHNSTFMGTSCIDFSIFNLLGSHTSIDDIKDAYVFIVSSLGNTLLHPLLPSPASLSQDPSYVTIENLEQSHNVKSLLGKMIAQEHGKEDVNGMEIYSLGKPEGTNFPNPVKISRHELRYLWGPIQETELTIALVLPLQEGKVLSSSYKCKGECHTADFEYNLPKPGKDRKLCNLSGKIIMENRNKGLLKFAPSCFIDVLSYIKKESHKQILDLYNIFNNPQPHDELLKKNLRPSVQLLKTAEKLWREQQSTNANLSKHTSGRYMGTSGGAFISFPGTPLKQQYDHRTTPWFHKARSTNGKRLISMTMPYCGKWGEDMMYTITNTLHDPAGNPVAVVAGDLPFQYILNDFRNQVPKCLSHTCLIVDHLGYVVLQSDWAAINSSRDSCTNDTKVSDHLVKRAPDIAQDMIASKILKRRVCNDYQNDTTFYYWTLGFSGHRTLHQGSTYKVYKLPQTNLYIIIRTAAKSRSKCNCPPVKQGSKEVMCYDTCALECECPCIAGPDTRPCQNETIDLHRYPVPACKPHGLVTVSPKFKSEDNIKNCS